MGNLITEIDRQLHQAFAGSEVHLEPVPGERIGGYMAWQGFEGISHRERQHAIWAYLENNLPDELDNVSAILAFTPGERDAYREGIEQGID
jgi:hypothetical protein